MSRIKRYYIAYGSNMNRKQMAKRCPDAVIEGTTSIRGYTLLFRGSHNCGVATIEPNKKDSVPVLIWSISKRDEKNLDIYEGFPNLYIKKDFKVVLNGETVTAMAYIMSPGRKETPPSDTYFNTIATGYEDFGFDIKYLRQAATRSRSIQTKKTALIKKVEEYAIEQEIGNLPICPRCGNDSMQSELYHNCLSRRADIYVCENCGMDEAIKDFTGENDNLSEWYITSV